MGDFKLILLIGKYAQNYHFHSKTNSLTELVKSWREYWPTLVPLPHPSPRNNPWLKQNTWFERELLPELQTRVKTILQGQCNA